MARRCFYSFHYKPDGFRASQVRNIGAIEGNRPVSDNDWEAVKKGGSPAIKRWIAAQMKGKSCTVILVGQNTAQRHWIDHEIKESWKNKMGVVGIRVHGLKNAQGYISKAGANPFSHLNLDGTSFNTIVKCYRPAGANSKERYAWISKHLANAVEEAVKIRDKYS